MYSCFSVLKLKYFPTNFPFQTYVIYIYHWKQETTFHIHTKQVIAHHQCNIHVLTDCNCCSILRQFWICLALKVNLISAKNMLNSEVSVNISKHGTYWVDWLLILYPFHKLKNWTLLWRPFHLSTTVAWHLQLVAF
jgi:hypothetical protein